MRNIKMLAKESLKFLACGYVIPNYHYVCGASKELVLAPEIWLGPWLVDVVGLLSLANSKLYGITYFSLDEKPFGTRMPQGKELNLSLDVMGYKDGPYAKTLQYLRFINPYVDDQNRPLKIRRIAMMPEAARTYAILEGIIKEGEDFCK